MKTLNILLVGVGGQGIITLAKTLAEAALSSGTNVLVAETHGLSQRGGSVEVHVRLGQAESPLIPRGGADVTVALELVEALRSLEKAGQHTVYIVNERIIRPNVPGVEVPTVQEALEILRSTGLKTYSIPATELAVRAGSSLATNMAMLGALAATGILDGYVATDRIVDAIKKMAPRWRAVNLEAYALGYEAIAGHRPL